MPAEWYSKSGREVLVDEGKPLTMFKLNAAS